MSACYHITAAQNLVSDVAQRSQGLTGVWKNDINYHIVLLNTFINIRQSQKELMCKNYSKVKIYFSACVRPPAATN